MAFGVGRTSKAGASAAVNGRAWRMRGAQGPIRTARRARPSGSTTRSASAAHRPRRGIQRIAPF
ncbi:protein of unassigned function [Methylobacterium oryzae CBMB20]|uniref:Protein of unassigned function n=1 Tax=Methylobacterium oryzae CBMB20 TaxID=693986 RepID=A0A089NVC8_9HYPH|nr:protein of unassigned function [Methylobacterium oryzae CBMB20]